MNDDFELVRGGDNVFRDLGLPCPEILQLKALLAAKIIESLDARKLTVRAAQGRTGFAAADFSRVRRAKLSRFTVDRLMTMLDRLGVALTVSVKTSPRGAPRDRAKKAA